MKIIKIIRLCGAGLTTLAATVALAKSLLSKRNREAEQFAETLVEALDEPLTDTIEEVVCEAVMSGKAQLPTQKERVANYKRFAAILARAVRLRLGPSPKRTEANRMVAWELLVKECALRDVRKCDRLRFVQLAVDMVFIPDELDVEMSAVRRSGAVQRRLDAMEVGGGPRWWKWLTGKPTTPGLTYSSG